MIRLLTSAATFKRIPSQGHSCLLVSIRGKYPARADPADKDLVGLNGKAGGVVIDILLRFVATDTDKINE